MIGESRLRAPSTSRRPVEPMRHDAVDVNRGAKRAREARAALGLDPAAPLACLLSVVEEDARLPVVVCAMPDGVAGACFRTDTGAVLWVNGTQWTPRQRFTLAHELGHVWCRHDRTVEVDSIATLSGVTSNPLEIQANAFAAELLVPRAGMERVVDGPPTLDEVVVIAAHYGVSTIVVVHRLAQLGLATERHVARLREEVEDRLHHEAFRRLGCTPLGDRLGAAQLPYLSPALSGTQLDAALRGDAAVDAAFAASLRRLLA
jgi:Zn-dependent peptidase ImmA (M78 family)